MMDEKFIKDVPAAPVATDVASAPVATDVASAPVPAVHFPEHVAKNLLEFLKRVKSKGIEAVAWVEAYQFVQSHLPQQGVPFTGLPKK
jgi:hypothetical protein